jgi:membrane-associated phospholipid phosphatase
MIEIPLSRFEKYIFTFFTFLFHPIIIPTYTLAIILQLYSQYIIFNHRAVWMLLTVFFVMTTFIPILVVAFMYYLKVISSFYLPKKEERISVSICMTIFYFIAAYLIHGIQIPPYIFIFIMSLPMISLALTLIQLFFSKISLHTFAIGSMLGILLFYRFVSIIIPQAYILFGVIILTGIVVSARLLLKAHNPVEVGTGLFFGMIISYLCIFISNGFLL